MAIIKKQKHINLIVIGHVDSGKSTATGRLIYELGNIDRRQIEKFEKESTEMGKGSFKYAWVLDKLRSERERGITIESTYLQFKTKNTGVTIIDAPGHRDFIKNMLNSAAQADAAVLMVSAAPGEFEAGIQDNGQTREHAQLSYVLGVKQAIVAINKMDSVNWSKERYDEVSQYVLDYLKKIGHTKEYVCVLPISGWCGDNMITTGTNMPWWNGSTVARNVQTPDGKEEVVRHKYTTLLEAIDTLDEPDRQLNKPLRVPILDHYQVSGHGVILAGRIESGIATPGLAVAFAPGAMKSEIKSMEIHKSPIQTGYPGDNIGFGFKDQCVRSIRKGCVMGELKSDPPSEVANFTCRVIILKHPGKIRPGYSPTFDCHISHTSCRFIELITVFNKRGQKVADNPEHLSAGDIAIVKVKPLTPMVVEKYSEYPALGRFAVRDMSYTVAVGIVLDIEKKPSK